ncbi:MAG: hypothetical protein IJV08_01745 [Bacteroidaceae bacterium]|nr:hypothetical protein [Bacteroidaceae bacterium]
MKKFLFLLCSLLTAAGMWAEDFSFTVADGAYMESANNYVSSWTSNSDPAVTVKASANNMDKRQNTDVFLWHSGSAQSGTYTFAVPGGYLIKTLIVTAKASSNEQTLTYGENVQTFTSEAEAIFLSGPVSENKVVVTLSGANTGLLVSKIDVIVEADPDYVAPVANLGELSNQKAYMISTERGVLGVSNGQLVSTSKAGFEGSAFALVKHNEAFYLWSVVARSFVNASGAVTNNAPEAVTIKELGNNLFQFFFGENCINVSSGYAPGLVINDWSTVDAGNQYTIVEAADFDPFAPIAILDPTTAVAKNLDFSETAPMDNGICTYDKDMTTNGTTYSGPQPVDSWEFKANGAITNGKYDQVAAGVFAYGGTPFLGGANYLAPPADPEGNDAYNALGLVAVWTGSIQYTQKVMLPAGNYKLTIPVYNSVGGASVPVKSLIGFVADNGTEYLAPAKAYPVNEWTYEVITFSLDEPTTGYYTLGYQGQNVGSASAQHLFFDGIRVETVDDSEALRTELASLLETAQATVEAAANVGDELFQKPTEAFNAYAAVVEAQKAVAENAEATPLELQAAVDALKEAAATYAAAVNAPKDYATYTFRQKASGLYLALDAENNKVILSEEAQEFTFEPAEGGYYVKNEDGYVGLAGTNAWTMSAAEANKVAINPTLVAAEIPEVAQGANDHQLEGGVLYYYTLNEKNGLIGTDGTDAGAACYANKAQNDNSLWTITENAPERFEYGKYLVQNVATGKYWGVGNSWGTQASLVDNPEFLKWVPQDDGTYHLESQVNNGGTQYYFEGDYMDNGNPITLIITKLENGNYTIARATDGTFYGYDGTSTVLGKGLTDAESPNAQWTIVSLEDAIANLANATQDEPMNATMLLNDANFGRNNRYQNSWTMEASNQNLSGGNNTNNCAESYHAEFTLTQTVDAPNGVYALTAQGFYRQDGSDEENLPVFYANEETATFPLKTGAEGSMNDASVSFANGLYTIDPIYVEVTDGKLSVGAKLVGNTNLWCIFDNFTLKYYGADADIATIKFGAMIAQVEELRATAQSLQDAENISEAANTGLATALSETESVEQTEAGLTAAIETLTAAIDHARGAIDIAPKLAAANRLMESTNVYTAEAYEAYKAIVDGAQQKYDEGTLTQAEAGSFVNPEVVAGWHSANNFDDMLLSAWTINDVQCQDFNTSLYINTWSVEGETDGSEFKVPFFEYWTGDDQSLGATTLTATQTGLSAGLKYDVSVWVRVRAKNGYTAPAYGITLDVNGGEAVDVAAGSQIGTSQFFLAEYTATGVADENGVLKININVAADNNISWLSFKNVNYTKQAGQVETFEYAVDSYVGNHYEALPIEVELEAIMEAIGATSTDEIAIYSETPGGARVEGVLGETDGWRNAAGEWQSWGSDARFYVQDNNRVSDEPLDYKTYYLGGMDGQTNEVASYTAKLVYVNKTTNAEAIVYLTLNYVEAPVRFLEDYTAKGSFDVNIYPTADYAAYDAVVSEELQESVVSELIGEEWEEIYGVGEKVDGKATLTNVYSCDPAPGFWCLEDGTANQWPNSTFGVSLIFSEDYTTFHFSAWTKEGLTNAVSTTFYLVNEATKEYVAYNVILNAVTTGISGVDATEAGKVIFDLAGRRINKAQKGIYIINGKKFMVK